MKSISIKRLPIKLLRQLPKLQLQSHRNQRSLPRLNSLERSLKKYKKEDIPHIEQILNKPVKCYTNITEPAELTESKSSVIQILSTSIVGKTQLLKSRQKGQHDKLLNRQDHSINKSIKSQIISPKVELAKTPNLTKTNICRLPIIQPPQKLTRVRKQVIDGKISQIIKNYPPGLEFQLTKEMVYVDKNRRISSEKKTIQSKKQNVYDKSNQSVVEIWETQTRYHQNHNFIQRKIQSMCVNIYENQMLQNEKIDRFQSQYDSSNDLLDYLNRKQRQIDKQAEKLKQKEKEKEKQKQKQQKLKNKLKKIKKDLRSKRQSIDIFSPMEIKIEQILQQKEEQSWPQVQNIEAHQTNQVNDFKIY